MDEEMGLVVSLIGRKYKYKHNKAIFEVVAEHRSSSGHGYVWLAGSWGAPFTVDISPLNNNYTLLPDLFEAGKKYIGPRSGGCYHAYWAGEKWAVLVHTANESARPLLVRQADKGDWNCLLYTSDAAD